jgi:hypothetical protein
VSGSAGGGGRVDLLPIDDDLRPRIGHDTQEARARWDELEPSPFVRDAIAVTYPGRIGGEGGATGSWRIGSRRG